MQKSAQSEKLEKSKRELQAKPVSLKSQLIAAIWIAGWSAFKFLRTPLDISVKDVLFSGIGIAACFSPVYLSIVLDKVKEIRFGDKNDMGDIE
ncbi:MAG: hypothetical protein ACTTJ1_01895 [Treponema sp.]